MNVLKILRRPNFFRRIQARTSKARCLTTNSDSSTQTQYRTLLLRDVPTLSVLNEVLDRNHVGPIERIQYDSKGLRAFLSFLDQETAEKFAIKVKKSKHNVDPIFYTGVQRHPGVEIVAAIGLRKASRCIAVNLPEGVTEESFKRDMSRFGEIQKAAVKTKKNDIQKDRRFGIMYTAGQVHFYSIESALRAVDTIHKERGKARFIVEECDLHLSNMYREFGRAKLEHRQLPEQLRSVYLHKNEGLRGPIHRQLMTLIQKASLPARGEVIQRVERKDSGTGLLIVFIHPEDALLFWNTCNSEGPRSGFTNATLTVTTPETAIFHVARAVAMGATRTLGIYNIHNWNSLSVRDIHRDFSEFGPVFEVRLSKTQECAFVKFAYISSSMKAIDHVSSHDGVFKEPYAGTAIGFASDAVLGNPPIALKRLRIRSANDSLAF
ncbi:hypothetical protein E1B28_005716 [Marasmius oreades]|uniref:RRM domain-containing protein n=1 Tax=Marasmius oreades TaxID=181124 RepID=A0A9P7UV42_9AGAR|nr:uncharacterized protein E1B28_005716 [Marasmius oreades]KAG7094910.1 hypothetical protein E1B28_005716 [Marasmius oreades]